MGEDDIRGALNNLPSFLASSNGEIRRADEDRYRDFIIARRTGDDDDDPEDWYTFGEVHLPPDSLDKLHRLLLRTVTSEIEDLDTHEKELVAYGEGQSDRTYLKYLTAEDFPMLDAFNSIFSETELESTNYHDTPKPSFQAIRVMDADNNIAIGFQYYWDNQLLGNTSLFNLYYRDESYEPMDEPIIAIPDKLDAIYYQGNLYIRNDWQFEQMFDYTEYYEEIADEVLDTIESSSIEFSDEEMVESAIQNNPIMMRKLEEIKSTGLYEDLEMEDIEWVINRYELEGIDIREENGESVVWMENKIRVWQYLHILNDDHVESELTERVYQTSDKKEL